MKANELRIGNLIMAYKWRCEGLHLTEVKTISMGWGDVAGKSKYVLCVNYEWVETGAEFGSSIEGECEPILLTEDWLVKFGFLLDENKGFEYKDEYTGEKRNIEDNPHWYLLYGDNLRFCYYHKTQTAYIGIPCKYIHQLQNLYYDITGLELNTGGQAGN